MVPTLRGGAPPSPNQINSSRGACRRRCVHERPGERFQRERCRGGHTTEVSEGDRRGGDHRAGRGAGAGRNARADRERHGCADPHRSLHPHLQPAAVRRTERRRPAGAARVWRAGRAARCERSARGRAGPVNHQPGAQSQQPRQPGVHGRHDVSRPVPRPRHDVRRGVETRRADGTRALDQYPDTIARSRFGLRRRTRYQPAALRSERPDQVQGRTRRRVRGSAAVGQ